MNAARLAPAAAWVLVALVPAGCLGYPQRVPGPLLVPGDAADAGAGPEAQPAAPPGGSAAVTLQRDSDPVWVRRAGQRGDSAVPFYAKRQRVPVGSLVRCGAGGRAELLWLPDATSLVLFDEGRVTLGDPELDEPVLRFHAVTRALLVLTPEDEIELVGGAVLTGAPEEPTGPVLLERAGGVLRLTNQSKHLAAVAYRSERLELGPGESLDLPLLPGGTGPRPEPGERLQGAGLAVDLVGRVERTEEGRGLALRAVEPAVLTALGVETRLEPGETARFSLLEAGSPADPADPNSPVDP